MDASLSAGKAVVENRRSMPGWDDIARECKGTVITRHPDGRTEARIPDKHRYAQMTREWRTKEIERSAAQAAAIPSITLRDASGAAVTVPEARAELSARRRGLRSRAFKFTERTVYHDNGTVTVLRRVNGRVEYS